MGRVAGAAEASVFDAGPQTARTGPEVAWSGAELSFVGAAAGGRIVGIVNPIERKQP
jgi:hypothetical protein